MKRVMLVFLAAVLVLPAAFAQNDSAIQEAVQKTLNGSRFKDVHASIQGGVVTLTGSVDLLSTKMNADQKVRHVKGVGAIRNDIQVNGTEISDQQLQVKLLHDIAYNLMGYVPVQFQAISVQVHNGVVLLSGHAAGPIAASDAVAVVENTKGVRDLINDLQVDPVSEIDERIRWAEFRSIYGYPVFNRYVMDPEKPIRIQVENGHVTLYGEVANQSEKNAAGIRANSVPGVFSVTNNLQVAGGSQEKPNQ